MKYIYRNKIIKEFLQSFYQEKSFELPKTLGGKYYAIPSRVLINYVLVKTFAINSYKLISDYIHLLEREQFDEN